MGYWKLPILKLNDYIKLLILFNVPFYYLERNIKIIFQTSKFYFKALNVSTNRIIWINLYKILDPRYPYTDELKSDTMLRTPFATTKMADSEIALLKIKY